MNSYAQDFTLECELFITGSNSNLLSGEMATLLSGRYIEFEIFPFSLFEFTTFKNLQVNKENFLAYLQSGGFPELLHLNSDELKRSYSESLRNTVILRDIVGRHKIKDLVLLEEIFKFLVVNIGNLTSFSSIVNYFKSKQKRTNYETVSTYVSYLLDTFLIHRAERYNIRGKQILGGSYKYYLLSTQKVIDREFGNLLQINDNHEKIVISLIPSIRFSHLNRSNLSEVIKHTLPLFFHLKHLLRMLHGQIIRFGAVFINPDKFPRLLIGCNDLPVPHTQGTISLMIPPDMALPACVSIECWFQRLTR